MPTTVIEFVKTLSTLRPASTFLVLHKYKNAQGEVASYNILFHISYKAALEKSLEYTEAFVPDHENELQCQAKEELIASFTKSLAKLEETKVEEIDDSYARFFDENEKYIKGVKLHKVSRELHLYGLVHQKRVFVPIVYPKVAHRPLTIEKKKIQRYCAVSRFRQFIIKPSQVEKISVEKLTLLPPDPFGQSEEDDLFRDD